MGENAQRQAGKEAKSYARDAELGASMETGMELFLDIAGNNANMVVSVVMVVDGRSGRVGRPVGIEGASTGTEMGVGTDLHHLGVQYGDHHRVRAFYIGSMSRRLRIMCIIDVYYHTVPSFTTTFGIMLQRFDTHLYSSPRFH